MLQPEKQVSGYSPTPLLFYKSYLQLPINTRFMEAINVMNYESINIYTYILNIYIFETQQCEYIPQLIFSKVNKNKELIKHIF